MLNLSENNCAASTLVLGLGNRFMSDDGVGPRLIDCLTEQFKGYPGTEFLDLGTNAMAMLPKLKGQKKLILIDCANIKESPGQMRSFSLAQVRSQKSKLHFSMHQIDLMQVMDLGASLGRLPEEVLIFGIQPLSIEPGENLSFEVAAGFESYVKNIAAEVSKGLEKGIQPLLQDQNVLHL